MKEKLEINRRRKRKGNNWDTLPEEIVGYIIQFYGDTRAIIRLETISKTFKRVIREHCGFELEMDEDMIEDYGLENTVNIIKRYKGIHGIILPINNEIQIKPLIEAVPSIKKITLRIYEGATKEMMSVIKNMVEKKKGIRDIGIEDKRFEQQDEELKMYTESWENSKMDHIDTIRFISNGGYFYKVIEALLQGTTFLKTLEFRSPTHHGFDVEKHAGTLKKLTIHCTNQYRHKKGIFMKLQQLLPKAFMLNELTLSVNQMDNDQMENMCRSLSTMTHLTFLSLSVDHNLSTYTFPTKSIDFSLPHLRYADFKMGWHTELFLKALPKTLKELSLDLKRDCTTTDIACCSLKVFECKSESVVAPLIHHLLQQNKDTLMDISLNVPDLRPFIPALSSCKWLEHFDGEGNFDDLSFLNALPQLCSLSLEDPFVPHTLPLSLPYLRHLHTFSFCKTTKQRGMPALGNSETLLRLLDCFPRLEHLDLADLDLNFSTLLFILSKVPQRFKFLSLSFGNLIDDLSSTNLLDVLPSHLHVPLKTPLFTLFLPLNQFSSSSLYVLAHFPWVLTDRASFFFEWSIDDTLFHKIYQLTLSTHDPYNLILSFYHLTLNFLDDLYRMAAPSVKQWVSQMGLWDSIRRIIVDLSPSDFFEIPSHLFPYTVVPLFQKLKALLVEYKSTRPKN